MCTNKIAQEQKREIHKLENEDLRRMIDTLSRENEENLYQMSIVRLVAESVVRGLQDVDYFARLCSDMVQIFEASICALFRFRHRNPSGWYLDAWAGGSSGLYPVSDMIVEEKQGLLEWVKHRNKPIYLENVENDAIVEFWGSNAPERAIVVIIPVSLDEAQNGAFVLIDPILHMSNRNIIRFIHVLCSLIESGFSNRVLYKILNDTKEELFDLFENASDMVAVVFPDGIIRDCNYAFREKIGIDFEPRSRTIFEVIKEDKRHGFTECWAKLLRGTAVENVDVPLKCNNGQTIETELSGNVQFNSDGSIGFIRLYLRDVTEKRRSENIRRELDVKVKLMRQRELAQVGLYVTGIAHNLKNPIHIIQNHLTLLKDKGIDFEELDTIFEYSQNITEILENLLDKIKLERDSEPQEIDINQLIKREMKFLEANMFFKHDVNKDFYYDENLPILKGVYGDISQAIMNVVYNALDAMKNCDEKKLFIRTGYDRESDEIKLSISDTGVGISEDLQTKIFEPFFTTKHSTSEKLKNGISAGSGLGLSSVKSLLEPYRGKVAFESTPGMGTTFYITFPLMKNGESSSLPGIKIN